MSEESQDIISHCLDAFEEDFTLSDEYYNQLEKSINIGLAGSNDNRDFKYAILIFNIHFRVMTSRIEQIWYGIDSTYENDVGFLETNFANGDECFTFSAENMLNAIDKYKIMTQFFEERIKTYSDINILENDFNIH